MDVRISYRVPFDEVPDRVQRLMIEGRDKLQQAVEMISQRKLDSKSTVAALTDIDKIRNYLVRVDNQLADCYSILAGYNKAIAESLSPDSQTEGHENDNEPV